MILDMLKKFGLENVNPAKTPMAENEELTRAQPTPEDPRAFNVPYREVVGALIYVMLGTRPDIAFAVSKVSQFLEAPKESHWKAVKWILCYLKGTATYGLTLGGLDSNKAIVTYADADWAKDTDDRRSISGYALFFGPSLVTWKTKKQPTVALSTTEAEYYALTTSTQEYLWTEQFLLSMGFILELGTIYNDNMGCISIIKNNKKDRRTKHIDIKHHAIREKLQESNFTLEYKSTQDMIADILTKPLGYTKLVKFREQLGVKNLSVREGVDLQSNLEGCWYG
jgi:hypothetical protein